VTSAGGHDQIVDKDTLIVGSVTADDATTVDGITSNLASGDDIYVTAADGTLTVNKAIDAGAGQCGAAVAAELGGDGRH